ncbi:MAG TPA: hypothetical protein VFT22_35115 [Kofleriaceae bacterium]|nr:hypothetical protein [Kofleriaceae bacterium]
MPAPSVTASQETRGELTARPDAPDEPARFTAGPATLTELVPPLAIAKRAPAAELAPSAATAKQEAPAQRVVTAPRVAPPVRAVRLADEVVVKAMSAGQPLFLLCFARAMRVDPTLDASKVHLHIELDEAGKITRVQSDTDAPAFASCLSAVARGLRFPAPGKPAIVDLPLMFR